MFKLTGVILILIADFLVVRFILEGKKKEISIIRDAITFLKNISIEIIELKKPLFEAIVINQGAVSCEIDSLINKFMLKNLPHREAIISVFNEETMLDENTKKILVEYLNIVGRTTKEGMEDFLSVTINSLNYILSDKIENSKNSKKIVNATVYSLSILFVIFIL